MIEMRRPENGDRLIVLVGGLARHRLIEILVFDPAARLENRAAGLGRRGSGGSRAEDLPNRQFPRTNFRP